MRLFPLVSLAVVLLTGNAFAQELVSPDENVPVHRPRRLPEYSQRHPIALGIRTSVRVGDYTEGGVGGHIRIRPHRLVAIELFSDNFLGTMNGLIRHDHEIGGTLQYTGIGGPRWNVYPMLGACAMLVMVEPSQSGAPTASDVHFGVHTGIGGEIQMIHGLAIQAQLEAIEYVGHQLQVYRWSAQVSPDLHFFGVGQFTLGANYYF